ncbi:MAG: hypothetical protein MJ252_22030 [archaeon]|nr:hypothetical protein [archaeon]
MNNLPDSVKKISCYEDLMEAYKTYDPKIYCSYTHEDLEKNHEYIDEFFNLSKELPEVKFYVAKKYKYLRFDIKLEDLRDLIEESNRDQEELEYYEGMKESSPEEFLIEDKRMFFFSKNNEIVSVVGFNKNALRREAYKLAEKETKPVEGYTEKYEDYEKALKENKIVAVRFQKEDNAGFDTVSKDPLFSEVKFLKVDLNSEDSDKFYQEIREKNLFVDYTYFVKDGAYTELKGKYNATKRKIMKNLCKLTEKEVPALPQGFILTDEESEPILKGNQFCLQIILEKEEDAKKFDYVTKDYPEVKILFTVGKDTKINAYKSVFKKQNKKAPYVMFFKDGQQIKQKENPDELCVRKCLSKIMGKPIPSFEGFPATVEEINSIIKGNSQVVLSSYTHKPNNDFDKLIKKVAPEAKLIKVHYKCEGFIPAFQKDAGEQFIFYNQGNEIVRVTQAPEKEKNQRVFTIQEDEKKKKEETGIDISERVMTKYLCKMAQKPIPKAAQEDLVDDLDEFKKIISENKTVFVQFTRDIYPIPKSSYVYNKIKKNKNLKDLKVVKIFKENVPEFVGDPLMPNKLRGFFIYVDGKIAKEFEKNIHADDILMELYSLLGIDPRAGYLSEKEMEKEIQENELVVIFRLVEKYNDFYKQLYEKLIDHPKYSKVKFLLADDKSFSPDYKGMVSQVIDEVEYDECYLFKKGKFFKKPSPPIKTESNIDYLVEGAPEGTIDDINVLKETIAKGDKTLICFFQKLEDKRMKGKTLVNVYPFRETIAKIMKECGKKLNVYLVNMNFSDALAEDYSIDSYPGCIFFEGGKEVKRMEHPKLDALFEAAKSFAG